LSAYPDSKTAQLLLFGIPAAVFVVLFAAISFAVNDETLKAIRRLGKSDDR